MKVEINLNDQVKFKPTAKGLMLMVERDANLSLGKTGSKHEQYTYHLQKLTKIFLPFSNKKSENETRRQSSLRGITRR